MTHRTHSLRRFVRACGCACAVWQLAGRDVAAQPVAGVGDDAVPIPARGWRVTLGGLWHDYTKAYAAGAPGGPLTRRSLFARYATSDAGVAQFPTLAGAEAALRTLAGDPQFTLSLGPLEAQGAVRQSIAPLALDYGVTRRLAVRLVVPYAESRDISQFLLNRSGSATTMGVNPAYGTAGATARAANGALLDQIEAARSALAAEITRCAASGAANCDAVRGDAAGAQALLARAVETRSALAALYGTAGAGGAPVVPMEGSSLHGAVTGTIASLRGAFATFGVGGIAAGAAPAGARLVMGPGGGFTRVATDSSFGVGYQTLGNTRRAGIGDIDLTATYLLFDTFGADQRRRLFENRRAVRSTLSAGWRFGVAGADRTEDAFDVPIGEGANAVLLRSTTDLVWSARYWLSATLRLAKPLSDEVAVVLPLRDVEGLFAPVQVGRATRSLGVRYDLELAPRVALGQYFGLSGALLLRHWGADRFRTLADTAGGTGAGSTGVTTSVLPGRTLRAVSLGATFSTLASYARGRSRFPAEVIYTHTEPFGASGGTTPATATERLELRVYLGFPRR